MGQVGRRFKLSSFFVVILLFVGLSIDVFVSFFRCFLSLSYFITGIYLLLSFLCLYSFNSKPHGWGVAEKHKNPKIRGSELPGEKEGCGNDEGGDARISK